MPEINSVQTWAKRDLYNTFVKEVHTYLFYCLYTIKPLTLHLVVFLGHFYTTWALRLDLLAPPWTLLCLLYLPGMLDQDLWQMLLQKRSVIIKEDQKTNRNMNAELYCIRLIRAIRIYTHHVMHHSQFLGCSKQISLFSRNSISKSVELCNSDYPDEVSISSWLCSMTLFWTGLGRHSSDSLLRITISE